MFASLRNKFSNYRTCSLRFDIEENVIFEAFVSLRFASIALTFAFDVLECNAPRRVCHIGWSRNYETS